MAIIDIDSDSSSEPEVRYRAPPADEASSNNISRPTPRSAFQKVEPASIPPPAPSGINSGATARRSNPRAVPPKTEQRAPPPRPSSYIENTSDDVVQRILRGERHSATFEGTSQYAAGGSSACGLASMNAIRLAFELCSRMTDAEQLVSALISEEFVRAAMGIATYWPNDMHLEVEPILQLPLFTNSIRSLDNQYAICTYRTFSNAVMALRFDEKSPGPRAVCLTRPPEVISVMHIPIPRSSSSVQTSWRSPRQAESIYLVFDSHPRPNHPNGAAVQILPSRSSHDVADYLMNLFQVDQEIMNDPDLEWAVQLLGQLSYHLLAPAPDREPIDVYEMNIRILEENWKRTKAEDKQKAAEAETRKLQQDIAALALQDRKARDEIEDLKAQLNRRPPPPKEEHKIVGWLPSGNRGAESSKSKGKGREVPGSWQEGPVPREEYMFSSWLRGGKAEGESSKTTERRWVDLGGSRAGTGGRSSTKPSGASDFERSSSSKTSYRPPPTFASVTSRAGGSSSNHSSNIGKENVEAIRSPKVTGRFRHHFDEETIEVPTAKDVTSSPEPTPLRKGPTRTVKPIRPIRPARIFRPMRPIRTLSSTSVPSKPDTPPVKPSVPAPTVDLDAIRSLELAARLQSEFDQETIEISKDELLAKSMEQTMFDCGICMETFPDEAIARMDECGHACCRDCMKGNIESMIEERRYPIPCPFCVVGSNDDGEQRREVGTIPSWVVETSGISPEQFEIYTDLQLAAHSVMIDCRGCSNSAFVDREEYDEVELITCPFGCAYTWCKECSQPVQNGEKHSCDGSAELENLMNQQGWKHCPGCRMPIERYTGCNHVSCKSPGCNVHFCFACGAIISRGGTMQEMLDAKMNHFKTCTIYGAPPAA